MLPILGNMYTLQLDILDQWYKSCDSTIKTLNSMVDNSSGVVQNLTRQQQDQFDKFIGSLPVINRTSTSKRKNKMKQQTTGTAVVTGGIGGIGTAICRRLATSGNRIIATYIAPEKDKALEWKKDMEKEGFHVSIYECDVADFDSCKTFAQQVEDEFGAIDILVNGAGITRDAMLKKMEPEKWHAVIDTNLNSVFNITRPFIKGMLLNKHGRIINISSVNGQKGQFGQTNYSTAKAGMIGFTRSLALELADKGITVNTICPGYVGTPMVEAIREDILNGIIAQIPAGRLARPEEIADAVAFLADEGSAYITGTELAVNGGLWLG